VLPVVLDMHAGEDPRLLVACATVCRAWRDLCKERIGVHAPLCMGTTYVNS
jgi:hypothetical protein